MNQKSLIKKHDQSLPFKNTRELASKAKEILPCIDKGFVEISETIITEYNPQIEGFCNVPMLQNLGIGLKYGTNKKIIKTTTIRVTKL